MTDRDKAISILAKARELCVQRIADFVVANEDELLTHAEGTGYANVESLFDAAEQLRHYSIMLDLMPGALAEPAQTETAGVVQVMMLTPITFRLWADQIRTGDIDGAIGSVSYLFQIEPELASRCTQNFIMKMSHDRQAMAKVLQIRECLMLGMTHRAAEVLNECFGLQFNDAVHVAKTLQSTYSGCPMILVCLEFLVVLAAVLVAVLVYRRLVRSAKFSQFVTEIVEPPSEGDVIADLDVAQANAEHQIRLERIKATQAGEADAAISRRLSK